MMDENELIRRIVAGDGNAYEGLVQRYSVGLIIHCERLVGEREAAEDIAQEAFVKAYTELSRYNPAKARFSTWLYRIATYHAYDYLRRLKHDVPKDNVEDFADMAAPDYDQLEQCKLVRDAVNNLQPPNYKKAIEAYYWQGRSYQQIAEEIDVPINTVRTWLRRAKDQLRKELT